MAVNMDNNSISNNRKGALLVIMAGACWGSISIFINYLSAAGLGEMQISFMRQCFAVLIMALILFMSDRSKFRVDKRDIVLLLLTGFINGIAFNFFYFYTILHSRASIAVVLLYTSPVFVMIMARMFFGEKFTKFKLIALVLTVVGCVLVTGILGEGYTPPAIAILTGVLTGFSYALNNILTSKVVRRNDPQTATFYALLFSFLFLIPFSGAQTLIPAIKARPMILLVVFIMSIVTAVIAQYLFSYGLKLTESGKVAIYGAAEPIVGTLVGILIFHEESNLMKMIGIAMVIAAIVLTGKDDAETDSGEDSGCQ